MGAEKSKAVLAKNEPIFQGFKIVKADTGRSNEDVNVEISAKTQLRSERSMPSGHYDLPLIFSQANTLHE